MRKRQRGFTLIELIAVLVILTIIRSIAIPSISASIERSKEKQRNAKIKIMESAAEIYIVDRKSLITSSSCYVKIDELISSTLINADDKIDPTTNSDFGGCILYNKLEGTYSYQDTCGTNYCIS